MVEAQKSRKITNKTDSGSDSKMFLVVYKATNLQYHVTMKEKSNLNANETGRSYVNRELKSSAGTLYKEKKVIIIIIIRAKP